MKVLILVTVIFFYAQLQVNGFEASLRAGENCNRTTLDESYDKVKQEFEKYNNCVKSASSTDEARKCHTCGVKEADKRMHADFKEYLTCVEGNNPSPCEENHTDGDDKKRGHGLGHGY